MPGKEKPGKEKNMPIKDLIPWNKSDNRVSVRRGEDGNTLFDLRDRMNRVFDEFFERPFGLSPFFDRPDFMGDFAPSLDVSETDKEITISAELPGMEPDDIHISIEHNTLTISGEKQAESEEKDKRYYRHERSYGSFYRSIPLPEEVDEDKIDASFKRGVLQVKLPKTVEAQKKSKRIAIKIE
jgi:HSP20 family protein